MKLSLLHLTHDDTYGPGTDLAMALLGIFILYVALTLKHKSDENDALKNIRLRQDSLIQNIATTYKTEPERAAIAGDTARAYIIHVDGNSKDNIIIKNKNSIQTIAFGENLLFDQGLAVLKERGQEVMGTVGNILRQTRNGFEQIQIQGHADILPPHGRYTSNLELASDRATTVFKYLRDSSGLDPAENLMSIVSFGEYKPVQRTDFGQNWNMALIDTANDTEEKRQMNRRIEIVLIYR